MAALADVCEIAMGQAPSGESYNELGEGIPLIAGAGDFPGGKIRAKKCTTAPIRVSRSGDIIVGIRATIGVKAWADGVYCLGRGVAGLRAKPRLDPAYLWHWLSLAAQELQRRGRGATFLQVNRSDIGRLEIPLPSIEEQRRIAAVLDQADELRANRQASLAMLDSLIESIFIDMFGEPAVNNRGYRTAPLGEIARKFSDGPFGSNLKSSHYVEAGVRVVRLQNIGVGRFVDNDAAYISEDHFTALRRHECLPGDVLVGTLGDPNLRACIQPPWLRRALNKADCVQVRVDPAQATSAWLTALLNQPSTESLAQGLVLGQTRARISMGRLRTLVVPVPPIEDQRLFSLKTAAVERQRHAVCRSSNEFDGLFASLQHRAFAGQL